MQIDRVILRDEYMSVRVNMFELVAMEMKYTLLELGFAYYSMGSEGNFDRYYEWRDRHAELIPGDEGRPIMYPGDSSLITSDPVLFALAYRHWWHGNGRPMKDPVEIPSRAQALRIQRNRQILNRFNLKYKGKLPSHWIADLRAEF